MFQRRNSLMFRRASGGPRDTSSVNYGTRKGSHRTKLGDLQNLVEILTKYWNSSQEDYKKVQQDTKDQTSYEIRTRDGRFVLTISSTNKSCPTGRKTKKLEGGSNEECLSLSTSVYSCTSDVQSLGVMRKALELNSLEASFKLNKGKRHRYILAILHPRNQSTRSDQLELTAPHCLQQSFPVNINLCCSCFMTDFLETDHFLDLIKDFVQSAYRVQSHLESADEGRLGIPPMVQYNDPDFNSVNPVKPSNPPSIVARLMYKIANDGNEPLCLPSKNANLTPSLLRASSTGTKSVGTNISMSREKSFVRQPVTGTRQPLRPPEQFRKSFTKTVGGRILHFSSPQEARVFELYKKHKSKLRAIRASESTKSKESFVSSAPNEKDSRLSPSKGRGHLSEAGTFLASSSLKSQETNDCSSKTPVISNKRLRCKLEHEKMDGDPNEEQLKRNDGLVEEIATTTKVVI